MAIPELPTKLTLEIVTPDHSLVREEVVAKAEKMAAA